MSATSALISSDSGGMPTGAKSAALHYPKNQAGITAFSQPFVGDFSLTTRTVVGDIIPTSHPIIPLMGLTTGLGAIWCGFAAKELNAGRVQAKAAGDKKGETQLQVSLSARIIEIFGALSYLVIQPIVVHLDLRGNIAPFTFTNLLHSALSFLTWFGLGFYAISGFLTTVAIQLIAKEFFDFSRKLEKKKTKVDVARFLEGRVTLKREKIDAKCTGDRNVLIDEGKRVLNSYLRSIFGKDKPHDLEGVVASYNEEELIGCALYSRTMEMHVKKSLKAQRLMPQDVIDVLREGKLSKRLEANEPGAEQELAEILAKIEKHQRKTLIVKELEAAASLLAGTSFALYMFATTSALVIAAAALYLASAAIALPLGAYNLAIAYKEGKRGAYDKMLLAISTAALLFCFAGVILLGSMSSFGALPLIVAMVILSLWLALNIAAYCKISKMEKREDPEKAELEALIAKERAIWQERLATYRAQLQKSN
jgi:hypothetical protein